MKSQGSTTSTSSPRPPSEDETTTADLPAFKAPKTMPTDPLDPERTTLRDPPGPETEEVGSSEASEHGDPYDDAYDEPSQTTTSATSSSQDRGFTKPEIYEGPIAALVQLASLGVHTVRHAPGVVWLADEEDVAGITAPLARIAARHSPVAAGQANDLADGIEAALGVANYAVKNVRAEAEAHITAGPPAPEETAPYQPAP